MPETVILKGLALSGVTVQGPEGPVQIHPAPDCPLAVYALPGWTPGAEHEASGHAALRHMEALGRVVADGRLEAGEVAQVAVALQLPGGRVLPIAVEVAEEVIRRVQDDGRLDAADLLAIGRALIAAGLR